MSRIRECSCSALKSSIVSPGTRCGDSRAQQVSMRGIGGWTLVYREWPVPSWRSLAEVIERIDRNDTNCQLVMIDSHEQVWRDLFAVRHLPLANQSPASAVLNSPSPIRPEFSSRDLDRVLSSDRTLVLPLSSIRRDGGTQHRLGPGTKIVHEYAALLRNGTRFPPVEVFFDGTDYWLADGFRRVEAAAITGVEGFEAVVRPGTKQDAQWASYAANSRHGLRRSAAETVRVIKLALQHPKATAMSDAALSEHIHVPRSTVQYWRARISCQHRQDPVVRMVVRGRTVYEMQVDRIGRSPRPALRRRGRDVSAELAGMRHNASPVARDMLNVIEKWSRGQLPPTRFLELLEQILRRRDGV